MKGKNHKDEVKDEEDEKEKVTSGGLVNCQEVVSCQGVRVDW